MPYFDLYDDDPLVTHGLRPNLPSNKEGLKTFYTGLWQAFPDVNGTFDDILIGGNKAAVRFTMIGTHNGSSWASHRTTDHLEFKA
jgi:SnoaL-like polyketide cyclase